MDERPSIGIHGAAMRGILSLVLAAMAACGPAKPVGSYVSYSSPSGEISCEIASDWRMDKSEECLLQVSSPDSVGDFGAHIWLCRGSKVTAKSLAEHAAWQRKNWEGDVNFGQDPVKPIKFGEFNGLVYSYTRTNALAARMPHRTTLAPLPVAYKETSIHFEGPGGRFYSIEYAAPTAIYNKHQPKLQHLLETFRWIGAHD